MSERDVWSEGELASSSDPTFGEVDYDNGVDANEAFAVDAVLKQGVAILQDQPQVALLGGLNLLVLTFLAAGVSFGLNLVIAGMGATGQLDQQVTEVLSQVSGMFIQLVAWPFNQLVVAGLMVAGGLWIRADVVSVGALYTSVGAATRGLLAGLVAGAATVVVFLVTMLPALAVLAYFMNAKEFQTGAIAFGVLSIPALIVLVYVTLGLMLAPYAAVLDHLGPVEAVGRSWQLADGARLTLFVTNFVIGILAGLSVCLCYLPLIAVVPVQVMGLSASYLRYSRSKAETDTWPFFERLRAG